MTMAALGARLVFEDEAGVSMTPQPPHPDDTTHARSVTTLPSQ